MRHPLQVVEQEFSKFAFSHAYLCNQLPVTYLLVNIQSGRPFPVTFAILVSLTHRTVCDCTGASPLELEGTCIREKDVAAKKAHRVKGNEVGALLGSQVRTQIQLSVHPRSLVSHAIMAMLEQKCLLISVGTLITSRTLRMLLRNSRGSRLPLLHQKRAVALDSKQREHELVRVDLGDEQRCENRSRLWSLEIRAASDRRRE